MPQPQPSDVGFGYLSAQQPAATAVEMDDDVEAQYHPPQSPLRSPLKSPLKSAMKSPGAAPRIVENPMSPTFKEEQILEKTEAHTDKEQRRDLKAKLRVRIVKVLLRGVNFSCSLIVISMLAATFSIFNATRNLPPRNNTTAWSKQTPIWPQITVLSIASVSLVLATGVIIANIRHGHRKAEKVAVYYTSFALIMFVFTIVMWIIGGALLQSSKHSNNGHDLWAWSCKDNARKQYYQNDVNYDLVCRMQNWSLVCIVIEVVVELFIIMIYGLVFYRFYSKRKLRKSMANRDRARSDLYLAQLRTQSAPNTPGFGPFSPRGPLSPRGGGWQPTPSYAGHKDPYVTAEEASNSSDDGNVQYAVVANKVTVSPKPFALRAPPTRAPGSANSQAPIVPSGTPPADSPSTPLSPSFLAQRHQEHVPAAPGEQQYAAVAIPGGYTSPLASPSYASPAPQQQQTHAGFDFGLHGQR